MVGRRKTYNTMSADKGNKKLTINNIQKLKGEWIGPLQVRHTDERDDYYYIEGISNVWTAGYIIIYRAVEVGMFSKAVLRRMVINGITEELDVRYHISLLEDREAWMKEMEKMMREGAWFRV